MLVKYTVILKRLKKMLLMKIIVKLEIIVIIIQVKKKLKKKKWKKGSKINDKTISYKLKFIDSARFMTSSIWSLAEEIYIHALTRINKKIEDLKKQCFNTYKFCKGDISKFILILQKSAYP